MNNPIFMLTLETVKQARKQWFPLSVVLKLNYLVAS